jgi:hypothetical protein
MAEVHFPDYRVYDASREEANNAMMALLVGSRLAAHTLRLTEGSTRVLSEIFPAVPHIKRFDLRTESARQLLLDADTHLGAAAVPYALAVHEDFVMTSLNLLKSWGVVLQTGKKAIKAWNMHEILFKTMNATGPQPSLSHYHLLRIMRNTQIHAGGTVSPELQNYVAKMASSSVTAWQRLTGRPPADIAVGTKITFTVGDIIASFAVIKELARNINLGLQSTIQPSAWAQIIVEDYSSQTNNIRNSDNWMRSLRGYARTLYRPLGITASELEAAAIALGKWTRPVGAVPVRKNQKEGALPIELHPA